jgi:hypothetical protein
LDTGFPSEFASALQGKSRGGTTVVFYGLPNFRWKTAQDDAKETASSQGALLSRNITAQKNEKLRKKAVLQLEIRCSIRLSYGRK